MKSHFSGDEPGSLEKGLPVFLHVLTLPRAHTTWMGLIAGPLGACKMQGEGSWLQNWSTHSEEPWRAQGQLHFLLLGLEVSAAVQREGRSSDLPHPPHVCFPPAALLGCHCSWELIAGCRQPCSNVIRQGCKLRISKGRRRPIEFQSTWLMLFGMAGNFSTFVGFGASEMEPHILQKCWALPPRL